MCSRCGGRFLPPEITDRVVVDELGMEREILREVAELFSGLKLPCPGCRGLMRPLRLRGVHVDLCFGCGGLWLDSGELEALSSGRHAEVRGPPIERDVVTLPILIGQETRALAKLGRGTLVVLLDELETPPRSALARAFARTDGLTDVDAQLLASHCHGVVAEALSKRGAHELEAILAHEGIDATVVADSVLRLPAAIQCNDVDVDSSGILARLHTGPPLVIPWAQVGSVVGGMVHRERLEPRSSSNALTRTGRAWVGAQQHELEHELISSDDVVIDVLHLGQLPRRLRVVPSPIKERSNQSRALCDAAALAGVPVGRGPRAPDWPHYRRLRELEREGAWVAWRAARWPPS